MSSSIVGTGISVPPHVVTNSDLERIMKTSDEWIRSRTGVGRRRFAGRGTPTSALAIEAGAAALADAGLSSVDVIVTATMTPDHQNPGIGGLVQDGLGLGRIPAFDLRQQCSGFLYGLDLADSLIASDRADSVLIIGAEVHAGYLPWDEASWRSVLGDPSVAISAEAYERNTEHRAWSVIFGDGAGAMVLSRSSEPGLITTRLHSDGTQYSLILVPGLGSAERPYIDGAQLRAGKHLPHMDGGGLYRQAVRRMPEVIAEVLEVAGLEISDIDLVVAHQANERILAGVRRQLDVDEKVVPSNIADWGNTTSGTLPILFHELRIAGRVAPGALVCFVAFGAGAHWGATLYRA